MTINLKKPDISELKPRITVFGVGGGGGNAVNNMINAGLMGVDFVVANTDAQALMMSRAERIVQLGATVTEGLGAGSHPHVGKAAAEECLNEIMDYLENTHMCFVTAGMGGGTGTGAAPVVASAAKEKGILTVGVVTKPFQFEGQRRMKTAEAGIIELQKHVDTLIVIPNQNLFRIANEKTTFAEAFSMADQVLYSGVACITDLMVKEGLINLDFADVRSVMQEMGKAMMGTGEASGDRRAVKAAEAAISNPLLDETSMKGARGLLISITGGRDITLFEVDEAASRIREEVDPDANIILGATHDEGLDGIIRVSVVATGIDNEAQMALASGGFVGQREEHSDSNFTTFKRNSAARIGLEPAGNFATVENTMSARGASDAYRAENFANNEDNRSLGQEHYNASVESDNQHGFVNNRADNHFQQEIATISHNVQDAGFANNLVASVHSDAMLAAGSAPSLNRPEFAKAPSSNAALSAQFSAEAQNVNHLLNNNGGATLQTQVKNLNQQVFEVEEIGELVSSYDRQADLASEEATPRGLWHKLRNSFKGQRRTEELARLEPAEFTEEYTSNNINLNVAKEEVIMPRSTALRQASPTAQPRAQGLDKPRQLAMAEEDELEIPAFLRQQFNK